MPFSITLRDIEIPPAPAESRKPAGEELVVSDPEARPAPWLGDPEAERAAHRAARRAQVRKDRLRDATPEADFPPTLTEAIGLQPLPPAEPAPPTLRAARSVLGVKSLVDEASLPAALPTSRATPPAGTVPPPGNVPTLSDALPPVDELPPPDVVPVPQPSVAPAAVAAPAASPASPPAVSATAADKAPAAPSILVLRAADTDPDPLCDQLRAFGFNVQVQQDPPDLPAPWPFVAVFIDQTLPPADGGDAMDLCNEVRERSRLPGVLKPVLVLVADQLSATNRVRAGLAGCNEILLGPITRGGVAKVLDSRGIALPSDARHS